MKYFRMSYEEIVFRRSYINILLLNRSIPTFNQEDENEEKTATIERKALNNEHPNELFMGMM